MPYHQTWVIWEKACLVITLCEWEYSSTPMKQNGSCNSLHSNHQSQSLPNRSFQSQSHYNQRRNNDPPSTTSTWDNSSNRNDDSDQLIYRILVLREAVHSNLHTLQLIQSSHIHLHHITQTMISNSQWPQLCESSQIQYSEVRGTNTVVNDDLSHTRIQRHQLIAGPNSRICILLQVTMVSQGTNIYWLVQA